MRRYLLFFASVLLFASCSRPEVSDNNKDTKDQMRFAASVPATEADWNSASAHGSAVTNGGASRGAVTDGSSISEFGVFCFNTARTPWASAGATALPNKLFDVEVRRTPSTSDWAYNPPVEWQGGDGSLFTFFGYSPRATGLYEEPDYPDGNNLELASTVDTPGAPTLRYTTIDYVPMQVDLLVAKPVYDTRPVERVRMQFGHALSQIRFTGWAAQNFVRVTSIEISGIKYKATLSLDDGVLTPETDVKTFVLDNINRTLSTEEDKPTNLSDGANAFMLLPQDLTGNTTATITATYEVGGVTKTSTPYKIIQNWAPNKAYTYVFNLGGNPTEEMIITDVTMTDWVVDSEEDMATTPPTYRPMPPAANQIVEIDGLKWTTGNLVAKDAFNCKVGAPEDGGLYFQFGSLIGWKGGATGDGTGRAAQATDSFYNGTTFDATGEVAIVPKTFSRISNIGATWPNNAGTNLYYFGHNTAPYEARGTNIHDYPGVLDGSLAADGVGDPCRYYLGGEWRLPTTAEFQVMYDAATKSWTGTWAAGSSIDSYFVGTFADGAELKFPAVGLRRSDNLQGAFSSVGQVGYYWSSSVAFNVAGLQFSFGNGGAIVQDAYERYGGLAVRCVSGTYVKPAPPHNPQEPAADQIVEIDGLQWTTGNLVASDASNCKVGAPGDGGLYFQYGGLVGYKGGATGDGTGLVDAALNDKWWGGAAAYSADDVAVKPVDYTKQATWPYFNDVASGGFGYYYFNTFTTKYEDFKTQNNADAPADGIGDPCAYYLGGDWRMPTVDEISAITTGAIMTDSSGHEWIIINGQWSTAGPQSVAGAWFGPNSKIGTPSTSTDLFFPASGRRANTDGKLELIGSHNFLWSSSVYSNVNGFCAYAYSRLVAPRASTVRSSAFPVRCVREKPVPPPPADSYIPRAVLEAAGWPADKLPKTGLQVAMRGDKQMPGTGTPGTDPTMQWKTSNTATSGTSSLELGAGKGNTAAMSGADHPAAQYCRDMGPEWYLPSENEFAIILSAGTLGEAYSFTGNLYLTSSEFYDDDKAYAYMGPMPGGVLKTNTNYVRCVREI